MGSRRFFLHWMDGWMTRHNVMANAHPTLWARRAKYDKILKRNINDSPKNVNYIYWYIYIFMTIIC